MYIGYIKLWRKLEDSEIFQNEKALKIWVWLLLRASYEEKDILFGRQKIHLNKGEFIMGLNKASENLNLAKSTIHFWVNYLDHLGMVELKKTNKFTIIKIKNWDNYQGDETQTELKKNSKRTLKETNKKYKKVKNDKEDTITYVQPSSAVAVQKVFKLFYQVNPTINFGNKTQRKITEELINQLGEDKVIKLTEYAVKVFGEPYSPTITNPLDLKNKLSALVAYYKKQEVNEIKGQDVSERRVL
jgi:hypothetical protein